MALNLADSAGRMWTIEVQMSRFLARVTDVLRAIGENVVSVWTLGARVADFSILGG